MANNNLKVSSLVLNEVKYVKEMLRNKNIPSVWNVQQVINRLTKYYLELGYNRYEVLGFVVQFLSEANISYDVEAVVEQVNLVKDVNDKKYYNLRDDNESIEFYEEEVEIMKQLSVTARKYYFSFLVVAKVQEIRNVKNPSYIYSDLKDCGRLIGFDGSMCKLSKVLIELGFEKKIISAPIDDRYVKLEVLGGTKVSLKIEEFNPMKIEEYYNTLFESKKNKKVVAIEVFGTEEDFKVYDSVRDAEKDTGCKKSGISDAINLAFKTRKTWETRNGLIFIAIDEDEEKTITRMKAGFVQKLQPYYKNIMKKKLILEQPMGIELVLYDEEGNLLDEPYKIEIDGQVALS